MFKLRLKCGVAHLVEFDVGQLSGAGRHKHRRIKGVLNQDLLRGCPRDVDPAERQQRDRENGQAKPDCGHATNVAGKSPKPVHLAEQFVCWAQFCRLLNPDAKHNHGFIDYSLPSKRPGPDMCPGEADLEQAGLSARSFGCCFANRYGAGRGAP